MAKFARSWFINGESGRYCHMQLWNAGSTAITLLGVTCAVPSASMVALLTCDAALDHSLVDAGASSAQGIDGGNALSSRGTIKYRIDSALANGGQIGNKIAQANTNVVFPEYEGMIIQPNRGIMIRTPTLAMSFYGSFIWDE